MAEPQKPQVLEVLEAVLSGLRAIMDDEVQWLTRPVRVELAGSASDAQLPRPHILILEAIPTVEAYEQPATGLDQHDDRINFDVHWITAGKGAEGRTEAHNGARDIRRWIRKNYQLGGLAVVIWDKGYDVGYSGDFAEAVVHAYALIGTDNENP